MKTPIENLELSVRTYATLKRNGINFVEQLKPMSFEQITSLKNIGRKSVEEIEEVLGIEFG